MYGIDPQAIIDPGHAWIRYYVTHTQLKVNRNRRKKYSDRPDFFHTGGTVEFYAHARGKNGWPPANDLSSPFFHARTGYIVRCYDDFRF